jgi:hypothetical protein
MDVKIKPRAQLVVLRARPNPSGKPRPDKEDLAVARWVRLNVRATRSIDNRRGRCNFR